MGSWRGQQAYMNVNRHVRRAHQETYQTSYQELSERSECRYLTSHGTARFSKSPLWQRRTAACRAAPSPTTLQASATDWPWCRFPLAPGQISRNRFLACTIRFLGNFQELYFSLVTPIFFSSARCARITQYSDDQKSLVSRE